MIEVNIESTLDKTIEELSILHQGTIEKAIVSSLNRTGKSVRSHTAKKLAKKVGVTQRVIRKKIWVRRAFKNRMVYQINVDKKHFLLHHFKPRQTKKGVTASAWGERKLYRHAFMTTINGKKLVMKRVRDAKGKRVGRFPIRVLYGPSLVKEFKKKETRTFLIAQTNRIFKKEFKRNLVFYDNKRRGKDRIDIK